MCCSVLQCVAACDTYIRYDTGVQVNGLNHTILNLTLGKLFAFRVQALSQVATLRSNYSDLVQVFMCV